jgi:hypothetical protein
VLLAGLDATVAVAKTVGKVCPMAPGWYSRGFQGGLKGYSGNSAGNLSGQQGMPEDLGGACTERTATAKSRVVSLAECALCQVHGEWTSCTERSL